VGQIPPAVGVARLIAESVDRWDSPALEANLNLLVALGRQARFYDLDLPDAAAGDLLTLADRLAVL
jgi:hypothetical protein